MRRWRLSSPLALGGLCAGLIIILLGQFLIPVSDPLAVTELITPDGASFEKILHLTEPDVTHWSDGLEQLAARPLFLPGRKFIAVSNAANVPPSAIIAVPQDIPSLIGIIDAPTIRIALFRQVNLERTARVRVGGTVGHWTVKDIQTNSVILSAPGGTRTLQLFGNGQTLSVMLRGVSDPDSPPTMPGIQSIPGFPPSFPSTLGHP